MQQQNDVIKPDYALIVVLLAGAFVAFLANTLLNIALPTIMEQFQISPSTVQWVTTGYMLVNGVLIPITAFLIQRFSTKKLFLAAMILFTAGTLVGGFAPSFAFLLAGRMIQASGAAIMMPLLMNVMLSRFPIEKRGQAMGVFGLVMIFAPAIGPTLSGYLIQHYDWPILFHIISPIAFLVLVVAAFKIKEKNDQMEIKIDVLSVILSTLGFGGILYGFSSAGDKGWSDLVVLLTLGVGFIALIIYIFRQFKLEKPMLDFRVYQYPMFSLSSAISITMNLALFSGMLLMPIYLQIIRGFTPLEAGVLMLPGAIVMGIMSPITGRLFDKFGAKVLTITGLSITLVSNYIFSNLTLEIPYSTLVMIFTLRMFGMSMVMMPVMTNGLNQLPSRLNPHGTAMNSTLNQVSAAIGSALLVTVMQTRSNFSAERMTEELTSNNTSAEMVQQIAILSQLEGINFAFFVSTIILGFTLLLSFFIKRAQPPLEGDPEKKVIKSL
ncbi:MFS transporter [Alkalihalobacillus alcalophilus ATCC 27647 = CGMCC 1.3604]|uniref:MFS transporter n=1 Tax=Alkalihalobacillus alcalophilus ATCC 27647 = CGMCC 1.3604 TaxID=1218173 RepID=J8THR1_ALKAL|nr:DHA2 family efflux MFS transporter permease subunit [Alkalihalobacillus alcalophilus]AFV25854.1 multidrug efflux transporter [Alkalihalobacillus alcalophilus ATCC 27647 = CGMCC 1.3604]KGA96400.1 MFS transporter [Alkalihalobacillus alcalophilus ATCC 27647 = CGMCC 1.3604]MED1563225.1 DHA2 family efflux MFS transporter permease subunit [Alkalihalobacillus alcalophilus]THG89993.1 MFS transporter [Alkalihalobacillus alcalophilus ATCC 27647 = CGMCC 1.3604]